MMMNNTLRDAQTHLESLPRIFNFSERNNYNCDVFLLPPERSFNYTANLMIETYDHSNNAYDKPRDLLRIIKVSDALNMQYEETNVLTPRSYAESLPDILWHITTQGILFVRVTQPTIDWIKCTNRTAPYGKHSFDQFWLPCCNPIENLQAGDILCIFNRRVGGWDGSAENPVVELLGAGGHLPTIWKHEEKRFATITPKENLQKEAREELGINIPEKDINLFGGYTNNVTHELVILASIMIDESHLQPMQEYAVRNLEENTQGIYLGRFEDVIRYYQTNPRPFAGGITAAPTNFPSNKALMEKVYKYLQS